MQAMLQFIVIVIFINEGIENVLYPHHSTALNVLDVVLKTDSYGANNNMTEGHTTHK